MTDDGSGTSLTEADYKAETAPFVGVVPVGSLNERRLKVTLPDGQGGVVEGILTAEQARQITLGLRSCAKEVDGEEFFAGGWSTSECLRYAARELEVRGDE